MKSCKYKDAPKHIADFAQREWCGCVKCKKIAHALIEEHNERAARLRYNHGKYMMDWEILGQ